MKNLYKTLNRWKSFAGKATAALSLALSAISFDAAAQCPNNNTLWQSLGTLNPGQSYTFFGTWGGEYVTIPVVTGSSYTISTCNGGAWDSQLTIYNNSGGSALGYNDDYCGLQSRVVWTASFTGTLRILLDQWNCSSNNTSMNITVNRSGGVAPANPCNNQALASCGSSYAWSLNGAGVWNGNGPWGEPGSERVYRFVPTTTGSHTISVTNNNSGWVDLFQSSSCGPTGWTYLNDVYTGTETSVVNLVAGTTYYFLLDDEDVTASNGSFQILCPVLPPPCNGPGQNGWDFTFTAPFNHSSTTIGACNDCNLGASNDRVYRVNITCPGTYVFSTCSGATWDTYLYLSTSPCGGGLLASNDDACSLQSSISYYLNTGTYYLTVEGFSQASEGVYALSVTGGGSPITGNAVVNGPNNVCAGSTAAYNVSGVNGASGYNWTINGGTILNGQGTSNITVAWANNSGNISVVPTSPCGNGASSGLAINVSAIPVVNVVASNVTCNGLNNGSISFSPSNPNWNYSIDGGVNTSPNTSFINLSPGTYVAVAQVNNLQGCSSTPQQITISQPAALSANISITNYNGFAVACNGGSNGGATVNVSGGTQGYNYSWSNGIIGNTISNVGAGSYSVTVTDANGCSVSANTALNQPSALSNNVSTSNYNGFGVSCNGGSNGSATANTSGGVSPYSYSWSNGGTQASINNLTAGNYNVVVTDLNGCTISGNANLTQPSALSNNVSTSNYNGFGVSCNGGSNGSATANTSGGVSPYSYSWSNGGTQASINNLTAGNYNVVVTDLNGCMIGGAATLTEPTPLVINMPGNQIVYYGYQPMSCAALVSTVSGGVQSYNYTWSNGANIFSTTVCPSVTTIYTLVVTDNNGCVSSSAVTVCAVNVICYAGNSPVQKVQICHVPPGNPNNPQTLCVSANAVADHLAHGDYLGTCGAQIACGGNARGINNVSTVVSAEHMAEHFEVFPNPAKSDLTIEFFAEQDGVTRIQVLDVMGRVVMEMPEAEILSGEKLSTRLDLNTWSSGVYFVKLNVSGQTLTKKVIVE